MTDEDEVKRLRKSISQLGDRPFEKPWELRVFALAVAAREAGHFEWEEFQSSLIAAIAGSSEGGDADTDWNYYDQWLASLEAVLEAKGTVSAAAVDDRTSEVLANPPHRHHHEARLEPLAVFPAV